MIQNENNQQFPSNTVSILDMITLWIWIQPAETCSLDHFDAFKVKLQGHAVSISKVCLAASDVFAHLS